MRGPLSLVALTLAAPSVVFPLLKEGAASPSGAAHRNNATPALVVAVPDNVTDAGDAIENDDSAAAPLAAARRVLLRDALAAAPSDVGAFGGAPLATAQKRKLLVINAVGHRSRLQMLRKTVEHHFATWTCVAMVHASKETLSDDELSPLTRVAGCRAIRWPGAGWGQFLQMLNPALVDHYHHVAILLDDVFLPVRHLSVRRLLATMRDHDVHAITPAVAGAHHECVRANNNRGADSASASRKACLHEVHAIEIYFTVFTMPAWACFYSMIDPAHPGGCAYDFCFKTFCPQFRLATDRRMLAYHLQMSAPAQDDLDEANMTAAMLRLNHTTRERVNPCEYQWAVAAGCDDRRLHDYGSHIVCHPG